MCSPFLDAQGNTIPPEQILGNGNTAVVLLQSGMAVKAPLRYHWSSDSDVKVNIDSIRREQNVFRRLHDPEDHRSSGVVRCIKFSTEATHLAYMANGDLRKYLQTSRPSKSLQLKWFIEMARTLGYIHDRRVLVADIASRNFLIDSDLSLKMCDFSEASIFPLSSDMENADDNGYTTQIDIGLLGAIMYEIVTGDKCEIDLYKDNSPTDGRAYWPERSYLPDTKGLQFGWIIEGCWDGHFRSAHSLSRALDSIDPLVPKPRSSRFFLLLKNSIVQQPIMVVLGVISLTTCAFIARKSKTSSL